jgi:LacI family transcriptional regulator
MRGKVTIQEIADMAGVSKFAVSRSLTGKSGVSAATRERILKVAGQLGYFQNNEPKRFVGERNDHANRESPGTIVVLFPNIRYQNKESVYWGPVFEGISTRLNQKGIDILTLTEPSRDHVFSLVKPEVIQGVITVGTISTPILLDIGQMDIPVVMVDHSDPAFHCDAVSSDNYYSMKDLMTKLVSRGYRSFQFVGNISAAHSYYERWLSYRTALESFGIDAKQNPSLNGQEADELYKLIPLLDLNELPEVFVCMNDTTAQFLIDEFGKLGINVPDDCAVTGFDNTCSSHPIFGTVDVNKELMGARSVDQLLWRMLNRQSPSEKILIYGEPVVRDKYATVAGRSTVSC